jgi:hypothetical protein
MDKKALFLKSLEDLEGKSQSQDWYDMLLISGLVYKLLYDEHPLVDEINTTKTKISFEINDRQLPNDPSLVFYSIEDGFDPQTSVPHLTKSIIVNKDGLYSRQIMIINSEVFTVKELIRFLRNKQGGVHTDNVSLTDKDILLKDIQTTLGIGGVSAGLRLMRAISRVVVRGLHPLK